MGMMGIMMVIMMVGMMAIGIGVVTIMGFFVLADVSEPVKRKHILDDVEKPKRSRFVLADDGELTEDIGSEWEIDQKYKRGF